MSTVALGFSGGVDSAVSAMLLKEQGYDVKGVFLDNGTGREDAEKTADFLKLPLEIIDVREDLEQNVCTEFQKAYLNGETPNPCIICNPSLKFKKLCESDEDYIATGHYAKTINGSIYKGHPENDQSYMLCRLTRPQKEKLILPLGDIPKSRTRELARSFALPVADKPDSMEICFIPDKDYIGWLKSRTAIPGPGDVIFNGEVIDRHKGICCYTVGQRYPGVIDGRKVYISRINAKDNTIVLSLWEDLFKTEVRARDFSFLEDIEEGFEGTVRVRHTKWENPPCTVHFEGDTVVIRCREPVRAPAAGQSAAVYDNEGRLIGGGFILP